MITHFLILLLSLTGLNNFYYQEDYRESDTIDISHIVIANKWDKTYKFGSATDLQKAFGYIKAKRKVDEILGGFYDSYTYRGLEVYFDKDGWEGTTIKNSEYKIVLNGHAYMVGNPISKLKAQFSTSYKNRYVDRKLILFICSGKVIMDATISIAYNTKGLITEIGVNLDNS